MARRLLIALIAVAIAIPAVAQEQPRFFIERIEVRGAHRVSPALIISETLLRTSTEYSEEELSAASARLNRLPFLLSATFKLERGAERPRYTLVIEVEETTPFFFLLDTRAIVVENTPHKVVDYDFDPTNDAKDAALGFRWFVGGRGIVHAGLAWQHDQREFTTNYTSFVAGYTQYDLFGTRAFATFNLRYPVDVHAGDTLSPQFVAGLPLTARQTLTIDLEQTDRRPSGASFALHDSERRFTLTWTYNTTDDPFVPTHGTIIRAAPLRTMRDRAAFQFETAPLREVAYAQHVNGFGADFSAAHYVQLNERDSVSAGLLAGWIRVDDRQHPQLRGDIIWRPTYEVLRGGWSRSLRPASDSRRDDSRIEAEARIIRQQGNVSEGAALFGLSPVNRQSFEASFDWARRTRWGMLRLGVGYAWGR
jgi:hypothetical protein